MQARCEQVECDPGQFITFPTPYRFKLEDRQLIRSYIDRFNPASCEFNFSNLFCWQTIYDYSWFIFKGRLVVYEGVNKCGFMPLGEAFSPEELRELSHHLICMGFEPDISIFPREYVDAYPEIERFYTIREERDHAEYIYRVDSLVELTGAKLHKKRNLISQFKRKYPDYSVRPLSSEDLSIALEFARRKIETQKKPSKDLEDEFKAIERAFDYFDSLEFEGIGLWVSDRMAAFSVFSRLNQDTYNVQFEKSDLAFKGAAQVINHETAKYLAKKCVYVNREQDLGIKGLRQAKLSYEPERLIVPHTLIFKR
jgi:uncharacterized protein